MTVAALDPLQMRYPFLTPREICFFLEKSYQQVRYLITRGRVHEALTPSGEPFRPAGDAVYHASELTPLLSSRGLEAFIAWQQGEIDVPSLDKDGRPRPLPERSR